MADEYLSMSELHDMGQCGGEWAACPLCDVEMARRMKAAAKAVVLCARCDCEINGGLYCDRCADKVEQIRMERLYDR